MTTCDVSQEILCDRTLAPSWRCRIFFSVAVLLSALFVLGAGGAVISSTPPALSSLLIGAAVTFGLILLCLELAASACQKDA